MRGAKECRTVGRRAAGPDGAEPRAAVGNVPSRRAAPWFVGIGCGLLFLAVGAPGAAAQDDPAAAEDPLFATLFAPELIMQHRRAIDLTDEQRDAISRLIQDLQGRVTRLQWELLDEVQQLTEITGRPRVDLDQALDQLGDVLDTENDIKQAHLEMLVRIKNLLTPEQQSILTRLRDGEGGPPGA